MIESVIYNFNIMSALSREYFNRAEKDSDPDCTTSILYSAFALEAYLNFAGDQHINCWKEIEKALSPLAKINLLAELLAVEIDSSRRPIQTVKEVFEIRNLVGHAKAEIASGEYNSRATAPKPKWEKLCTLQLAERAILDTRALIYTMFDGIEAGEKIGSFSNV